MQLDLAQDAMKVLLVKVNRERAEQETVPASSPKRIRVDSETLAESPPMTLSESLNRMDPLLLRQIMYMACDRDINGTPLNQVAEEERLKAFRVQE